MGLGSSGATAAATVYAINALLGSPLEPIELVRFAGLAEALTAGAPHYDNVAASLLGGLVILLNRKKPRIARLRLPPGMRIVLFIPKTMVLRLLPGKAKTQVMREVLPETIEHSDAVEWVEKAVALALGLSGADPYEAIKTINYGGPIEATRAKLIPGYWEAKKEALQSGALAFNISGAGPTLFAVVREGEEDQVMRRVSAVLEKYWGSLEARVVDVDYDGARLE
ncbi:homoserine kinase [Hyperthermus butylicus]|uniref:Homoserine kinase n=1 Tax=Hyperthermus butylicus (strain DSM 5456 / JCM 9403 / PLM1-5) TaxID=415426 RepID=A2BL08_HYPBU|nr:hypothetical protein [Hyperthermus butylicus]ABM80669.1 Homoserine kinase [Hyperthermus butylicus DSM 5456]